MTGSVPDPEAFAALLCDWCMEVAPGDRVGIMSTTLAEEVTLALHRAVLERDAWPYVALEPPGLAADLYRHAHPRHRSEPPPTHLAVAGALDAFVRLDAPANTTELADADPAVVAAVATARKPLQESMLRLRWTGTILPTAALAQQARMSTEEYAAFVNRALFLDRSHPVQAWRDLSATQEAMVARLSAASEIRIEAEGTDVRLNVAGRTWINSDGHRNMPSGEVFTGPHEDSATGTIRFTVPTGPRGVTVTGVELRFEQGKVVSAQADQGDDYLQAALATDAGARYLGELGIGTNAGIDRATGHILLDEKMAGTVHLALGRSYPETGGTNDSALHWDLICDLREGGRLSADGEPIVVDGAVTVV
ncbi:MAG TPA: aminopeptidase [Solirubrobacteraceae bacterium]|jgi:aminopeptidase|nr:aminopeptidase [Solirubrobacteraceae bacterium]